MKHFIKITIICLMLISGAIVIKAKDYEVDYTVDLGNELSDKQYTSNFISTRSELKEYSIDIPQSFELVGQNQHLALYLEKETLAIAIKNLENGYVWFSYDVNVDYESEIENNTMTRNMVNQIKSGVMIKTYNKFTLGTRTLLDENLLGKKLISLTYDSNETGFTANVDFTDIMIKFNLSVSIDNDNLVIEVPYESVQEYDPELWTAGNKDVSLNDLLIYPFLGATKQEDNGYVVIPDGSGAIVSLKETPKHNLSYSASVYGTDKGYEDVQETTDMKIRTVKPLERVTLPIFGLIHDVGNTGLLVISESGSNYATYNYVSKDVVTDYYQTYFHYNYRTTYKQFQSRTNKDQHILGFQEKPNQFLLKQRYVLLTGDEADYVGVAKGYREYLEEHNGFSNPKLNNSEYTMKIDLLANEIERGIFRDKNVTLTTYNEAIKLIKILKNDGYNNLNLSYKTYSKKESAYRFDVYRNLGGTKDLQSMLAYFKEQNIDFSYFVDYLTSYEITNNTANRMNKKALSDLNYSYMFLYSYINNTKYLNTLIKEDLNQMDDYDIASLSINGLNQAIFTHREDHQKVIYSTQNMQDVIDSMELLKQNNKNINIYNPDAYLYAYTNKYYDAPITSSELLFIDTSIPLVQLVTSGHMDMYSQYLNFISSERNTLLRLVEYGVNPSYIMTSKDTYELKYSNSSHIYVSQYESLKNRIASYDSFMKPALERISGVEMVNHYYISEGVAVSEFANGIKVVVNYTKQDIDYEGQVIKAEEYDIV